MHTLHRYEVVPSLPQPLEPLRRLAHNLWWAWNRDARDLFARIDPAQFEAAGENPLALLARASQRRLDELAQDEAYLASLAAALRALDDYLAGETWFDRTHAELRGLLRVAYFSMEFGIHECLPVYSGGLGVLAGDHLKTASDLGVPLVGVGIAFSQGYFHQQLDEEGWQVERYPPNDWHDLPVAPALAPDGSRARVSVVLPTGPSVNGEPPPRREVSLEAWRVDVGRVSLYLLDANLEHNALEDRTLTNTLYGGDRAHRIRQEILLGVGGLRMLRALGIAPTVCHMNEGHSAFLALERIRQLMSDEGASFAVAREVGSAGNVFTTHTPVPAGNDAFAPELIAPYLSVLGEGLGMSGDEVARLGRASPEDGGAEFSMPVLAIRTADKYNGVSVLHGREARVMWRVLWPTLPLDEVPIGAITNGVHARTWIGPEVADLLGRHLGPSFGSGALDAAEWARVLSIPDEEIWRARQQGRERFVARCRRRMRSLAEQRARPTDALRAEAMLDPKALTIGFARRFATYKRGTLLLRDPDRLLRIVSNAARPVQLVFAGKAHPQDWGGKELIRDIVRASQSERFRGRIVFIEDYDMGVARSLVTGVDVWLNTPRRPLEASGTSGMKAAMNGVLHASILDGWWCEAFTGDNGFAIGRGEEYADTEHGDRVEAHALYRLLEEEIVPLFYDRDAAGLPRGWIARMKRSIATIGPAFNTVRMVRDYAGSLYAPASRRVADLRGGGLALARALVSWKERVESAWRHVRIETVTERGPETLVVGQHLRVVADVALGGLAPQDVAMDLYFGRLHGGHTVEQGASVGMACVGDLGDGRYRYEGTIPTPVSGEHAFAVRVRPHHPALADGFAMRLLAWG
jgi:starch phosphorylase